MRTRGWVFGLALTAVLACGLDGRRAGHPDGPEFAGERREAGGHDPFLDMLDPEEREALARSQMTGIGDVTDGPKPPQEEDKADRAGKVGLSILTVAISLGAAAAPFLLF